MTIFTGTSGNDILPPAGANNSGNDSFQGGAGNDIMSGGAGADTFLGGAGVDTVTYAGSGAGISLNLTTGTNNHGGDATGDQFLDHIETVIGSRFMDAIVGTAAADRFQGGDGNDYLHGAAGNDVLLGEGNNDFLYGEDGNDSLSGGNGVDHLAGGAGDDIMRGGTGSTDIFNGGAGTDTVSYDDSWTGVTVNLATGVSLGGTAYGDQFLDHIEVFAGSRFADVFTGGGANDSFLGGNGNDTLSGGAGTNHLDGGNGNDVMYGGAGADTFMGGAGSDRLYYTDSTAGVHVDVVTGIGSGGDAAGDHYLDPFESITGSAFNDVLAGGNSTVVLAGGAGDDVLSAGLGPTAFQGGDGFDTVSYASSTIAVTINLLDRTASGGAAGDIYQYIEAFTGSAFNDTMTSGTGDSTIHYYFNGGGGDDTLIGSAGGVHHFDGGDGNDVLDGGYRGDTLIGGAGADILQGHDGEDVIDGGAGDDTLVGGVSGLGFASSDGGNTGFDYYYGDNTLTGGAGADHFVFEARDSTVIDTIYRDIITDFSGADGDKIDLSQIVSSISFIGTGAFTGVADQLRYEYDSAHNQTLVGLDRDGDGKADYGTTLDGNVTLTAGDFLV